MRTLLEKDVDAVAHDGRYSPIVLVHAHRLQEPSRQFVNCSSRDGGRLPAGARTCSRGTPNVGLSASPSLAGMMTSFSAAALALWAQKISSSVARRLRGSTGDAPIHLERELDLLERLGPDRLRESGQSGAQHELLGRLDGQQGRREDAENGLQEEDGPEGRRGGERRGKRVSLGLRSETASARAHPGPPPTSDNIDVADVLAHRAGDRQVGRDEVGGRRSVRGRVNEQYLQGRIRQRPVTHASGAERTGEQGRTTV